MANASSIPIVDCNTVVGFFPRRHVDTTPQALLSIMDKYGVVRALCISTTGIFYDYRRGNEETLAIARNSNNRLLPVATVDPRQYLNCAEEIERRARQGWRLFRFFPDYQGWPLNFAPFREIVHQLNELQLAWMIPVQSLGAATQIADMVADLQTPVIFTRVSYSNLGEVLCVMKGMPHIYVETHLLNSPDAFEVVAATVGVERLIFGSFAPLHYFASAYMPLQYSSLSDDDKRKVLVENIRVVLQPTKSQSANA